MEQDYMQQAAEEFDSLRNTFDSIEKFEVAIAEDPGKYGADFRILMAIHIRKRIGKNIIQHMPAAVTRRYKMK